MKDLNYQLGYFVGEHIVDMFLPTLSIAMITTRTRISCTISEADEYKRLEEIWHEEYYVSKKSDLESWANLREYYNALEIKYLPHLLKCWVSRVTPTNMDKFKKGLINNLWNCDTCSYSLNPEDIDISNDSEYHTLITFKLSVSLENKNEKPI